MQDFDHDKQVNFRGFGNFFELEDPQNRLNHDQRVQNELVDFGQVLIFQVLVCRLKLGIGEPSKSRKM